MKINMWFKDSSKHLRKAAGYAILALLFLEIVTLPPFFDDLWTPWYIVFTIISLGSGAVFVGYLLATTKKRGNIK